jgi:hypothetical protein
VLFATIAWERTSNEEKRIHRVSVYAYDHPYSILKNIPGIITGALSVVIFCLRDILSMSCSLRSPGKG